MAKSKKNDSVKISIPNTLEQLKQLEEKNFIQSNEFIESGFLQPFKELELKVLALISKYINENKFLKIEGNAIEYLQKNAGQTLLIKIPKKNFCDFLNTDPTNFYKQIKTLSSELIKKAITIESLDSAQLKTRKKFITVTLFAYIACKDGEAIFGINPILQIYLQHLKSHFTVLSLEHISKMNSGYAIKIYQLLKQYEVITKRTMNLEELKTTLGTKDLYTDNFKDFRKYVLEVAIKNINEHSDIEVSFKSKKTGKKVEEIEFKITSKQTQLQQAIKAFREQMDVYFSRSAPFALDEEHRLLHQNWIKSKKAIEQNQALFEEWIENTIESYNAESTTKLLVKSIQEFGTPAWYSEFLNNPNSFARNKFN